MKNLKNLPVLNIAPSPTNPRQRFEDIEELAQSIAEHGVLQPILVRRHPELDGMYELIAGERRFRAAKVAGLSEIPAIIGVLSDADVLEVQLVENNQRRDVSPFEEAAALQSLIQGHGRTVEDLADKLGRPESYVRRRLLLCALQEGFEELHHQELLPLNSCEFIAQLPAETQVELAQYMQRIHESRRSWRLSNVREVTMSLTRRVSQMPWLLSATYGGITPCSQCPSRSSAQAGMFEDEDSTDSDDRCLNAMCFGRKMQAWATSARVELIERENAWGPPEGCVWRHTTVPVEGGKSATLESILGSACLVIVHSGGRFDNYYRQSTAINELRARGFELAAAFLEGRAAEQGTLTAAEAKEAKKSAKAEAANRDAAIEQVVEWCAAQPWEDIVDWIVRGAVAQSNVDVLTGIVRRRAIPMVEAKYSPGRATMLAYVETEAVQQDQTELKRLLVELFIRPKTWTEDGVFEEIQGCITAAGNAVQEAA